MKNQEMKLWEAAKNRNRNAFLDVVMEDAVMVCGGYRCSGADYAAVISEFDCKDYVIEDFEVIWETEEMAQVHYIITTVVNDERYADLAGCFHVTTTWKKIDGKWKVIFNMDQRIARKSKD